MLIPLHQLIKKHNLKIRGVIHCGANNGAEYNDYLAAGISNMIWVEPCSRAFEQLQQNVTGTLFNCALGSKECEMDMHVETKNNGQSNSLLKPALHTKHYPDIVFNETETVQVHLMDSLDFDRSKYNFLNLDVQGFELHVLQGGVETLKNIDYIYTEVNREPLYEECAQFDEMTAWLEVIGFKEVETYWTNQGWGDSLFMRQTNIVKVPPQFQPVQRKSYPEGNYEYERWFFDNTPTIVSYRTYLPIFWTGYYTNNQYGQDFKAKRKLQEFVDSLPTDKKYWTICQYDDGCMVDWKGKDVRVYGMSGGQIDYPLPLICTPYPVIKGLERIYTYSFVGKPTHAMRQKFIDECDGARAMSYVSTQNHSPERYNKILAQSKYVLCFRGYGKNSFRIMEAINQGAIPVYISDEFIEPHNVPFGKYGIMLTRLEDIDKLEDDEKEFKEGIFDELFTYEATQKLILQDLLTCK